MRTPDQPQWQLGRWAVVHVPQEMALLALAAPDNFYRVNCSDLEVSCIPRSLCELLWHRTLLHFACVVGKICERFNPSTCRCGAFECRPLAQIAICGMRRLNCGSSSRFRIRLARMWVKTNGTKIALMDISNIGCWLTF